MKAYFSLLILKLRSILFLRILSKATIYTLHAFPIFSFFTYQDTQMLNKNLYISTTILFRFQKLALNWLLALCPYYLSLPLLCLVYELHAKEFSIDHFLYYIRSWRYSITESSKLWIRKQQNRQKMSRNFYNSVNPDLALQQHAMFPWFDMAVLSYL